MLGGVRRVQYDDSDEAWERDIEVDDGEVRFVDATRVDCQGGWNVAVSVMEFVREEPLEGELRRRIAIALRSVETGTPSGEALVRAVGEVLDGLAEQTWAYVRG